MFILKILIHFIARNRAILLKFRNPHTFTWQSRARERPEDGYSAESNKKYLADYFKISIIIEPKTIPRSLN